MTSADWVIAAVLALCTVLAWRRGFLVEVFSLVGIVVGVAVASWNYTRLLPWFEGWLRPQALAEAAAFLMIALGVMIAAGLVARAIRLAMRTVGLGWADRLLGAAFGFLKGGVLVTLGVMLLLGFSPGSSALEGSRLSPYFVAAARESTVGTPAGLKEKVRLGARLLHERTNGLLLR